MYVLAIDQGTTSSRVALYDLSLNIININTKDVEQIYPAKGWLEHDAEQIFIDIVELINNCLETSAKTLSLDKPELLKRILGIGITNQRETTVVWDKTTGKPVHNAIVWQDRRTTEFCKNLKANSLETTIQDKTGLLIDPYFSASKINWLLEKYKLYNNTNILFGTIDTYLTWRLTSGKSHVTDVTNASRTQIYNIKSLTWDPELLEMFNIPGYILPEVKDCASFFGLTDKKLFGASIPITGIAGDQQSAAIGQMCFEAKQAKITYGTGCFVLQNTGKTKVQSQHKLISTIGYKIGNNFSYALEGSIFVAGAAVNWLKDAMNMISSPNETESIAESLKNTNGVYLVPAFTGLGAPYWDPEARGAILGLTRDTGFKEIVRAALESVCYQTHDLLSAFEQDYGLPHKIRVDGGMSKNNWFLQFLADITNINIEKPKDTETTIKGAAILAAIGCNAFKSLTNIPTESDVQCEYTAKIDKQHSDKLYQGWLDAVNRVKSN